MESKFYEEADGLRTLRPGAEDPSILWFRDDLHNPYPTTPLAMTTIQSGHDWGIACAAEEAQLPGSRGHISKSYGGRVYRGFSLIQDPAEIGRRAPKFGAFVTEAMGRWDTFYGDLIGEAKARTLANVKAPLKEMTLAELAEQVRECKRAIDRCWYIHFTTMLVAASNYMMGEKFAKEHGFDEDRYAQMLKGSETMGLATDRGQYQLAEAALAEPAMVELLSSDLPTADILAALDTTEAGRTWSKKLREYLDIYGFRLCAAVLDLNFPTWYEDPSSVVKNVQQLLPKLRSGVTFDGERAETIRLRDEAITAFRATLSTEDAATFDASLPRWQKAYAHNEDHWYYLEQVAYTGLRWVALEAGERMVSLGILDDREDVFQLNYTELEETLARLAEDAESGRHIYSTVVRPLVTDRKRQYADAEAEKGPDFVGVLPDAIHDPLAVKIYGLSGKILARARGQREGGSDGVVDMLEGFPGSPGVVEGPATLVWDYKGFAKIEMGAIMVCQFTSPAWTSVFPKLKGVVTDSGGMLTHAAIAAREYGVPAVVGTWIATSQIKDGDIIRIDGNQGTVEILQRAAV